MVPLLSPLIIAAIHTNVAVAHAPPSAPWGAYAAFIIVALVIIPYFAPLFAIGGILFAMYWGSIGFLHLSFIFAPLPYGTRFLLTLALIFGVLFLLWYLHRRFVFWLFGKRGFNYDDYQERQRQSQSFNYQSQASSSHNHSETGSSKSEPSKAHEILGIPQGEPVAQIRRAYIEKMKLNHPDKVASLDPYLQKIAKERTQEIQSAYEKLTD